jgi:hypothetical protein
LFGWGAYGFLKVDEDYARMVRQWWFRLSSYRVRVRYSPKADAKPPATVIRYEQFHHRRVKGNA